MIDEYQDFHQAENPRLAYQQYQPHIEAIIQRMCTPSVWFLSRVLLTRCL